MTTLAKGPEEHALRLISAKLWSTKRAKDGSGCQIWSGANRTCDWLAGPFVLKSTKSGLAECVV